MTTSTSQRIISLVEELSRTYQSVKVWQVAPQIGYGERHTYRLMNELAAKGKIERVKCGKCRQGYRSKKGKAS